MLEKIINLLKDGSVSIPRLLLTHYHELELSDQELIFVMYLLNGDPVLDPKKTSQDLRLDLAKVFELISNLESKDILKIETYQNKKIREEALNFDGLFHKLGFLIVNDKAGKEEEANLFDLFESEFGRTLSPMEYEIINGWKEEGFQEELIVLALKEATYNGVNNLRYIDKILYDWKKKGIQTKQDVEKNKREFKQAKEKDQTELFEYDWLNDHE